MQRTLLAALLLCIAGTSPSAQPEKQQPAGTTRVAVVNLAVVLNTFSSTGRGEFPKESEQTNENKRKAREITDEIKACEIALQADRLPPARAEELRARIAEGKRQLAEMSRDIERILAKRQEDNLVAVWTEIQTAIKSYATEKQIDLVLAYGDPVEKELLDRFPNVKRKMESMDLGGTTPLHFAAHVDISNAVVKRIHDLRAKRK